MNPRRRAWLGLLPALAGLGTGQASPSRAEGRATDDPDSRVARGRVLRFPRDHGAHLGTRIEWWYATGWLGTERQPLGGFQITFFRTRTGLAEGHSSRFAARHLLFAHAALTVLGDAQGQGRHLHAARVQRWTGDPEAPLAAAALDTARVHIGDWRLALEGTHWRAQVAAPAFSLQLTLSRSQPLLLQGEAGFSRKGPDEAQASHYVTEPQLAVRASGRGVPAPTGRAWMDHEWSHALLHPQAVGWDWIGINLFDGGAFTAFRLRRADGSALWAGGSLRPAGQAVRSFGPHEVRFAELRRWQSPATGVRWPVAWQVDSPAGRLSVQALADAQELDSRSSTGTLYWEGLAEVLDERGRRVGLGYLELTGYGQALRL